MEEEYDCEASMGPRPIRRGNGIDTGMLQFPDAASMGPRPIRRGNGGKIPLLILCSIELQWGHVQSDVETSLVLPIYLYIIKLQWGHVQSDVETHALPVLLYAKRRASMGPRPIRRGNRVKFADINR